MPASVALLLLLLCCPPHIVLLRMIHFGYQVIIFVRLFFSNEVGCLFPFAAAPLATAMYRHEARTVSSLRW